MLSFLALLLLIALSAFVPGYLAYCAFFRRSSDEAEESVAWSYALAFPILGMMQFASFLLKGDIARNTLILYAATCLLLAVYAGLRRKVLAFSMPGSLGAFLLLNIYSILLLGFLPSYFYGYTYDWQLYFPNTEVYLGEAAPQAYSSGLKLEYLIRRTPLFSLVNSFFLGFAGRHYYNHQVISTFLNSFIFWNILLLARKFFDGKTQRAALVLLVFMPILMLNMQWPIPKAFMSFYSLLALMIYTNMRRQSRDRMRQGRDAILTAVFAVTAYMCHPSALFYVGWIGADQFWLMLKRKGRPHPLLLAGFAGAFLLMVLPWLSWGLLEMGAGNVFTPSYTISENAMGLRSYLFSRATLLLTTVFFPVTELAERGFPLGGAGYNEMHLFLMWGNTIARAWLDTFLWGFTLVGAVFFAAASWRARRKISGSFSVVLLFVSMGALACLAIHFLVDLKAHAFNIMAPLTITLFVLLSAQVAGRSRVFLWVMAGCCAAEYFLARLLLFFLTLPVLRWTQPAKDITYIFERLPSFQIMAPYLVAAIAVSLAGYFFLVLNAEPEKNKNP